MNYLIIFLVLVSGFNIYFHRGQKRFDWFVCSMMVFSSGIILLSKPQMPCHRFLLICYWLSVLKNKEYSNKVFPLKWILLVYILGLLVVSFNSPHLNVFYKLYKPFVFLIDTYLILLLTAFGITKETLCSKAIIRTLYFVMLYATAFSFFILPILILCFWRKKLAKFFPLYHRDKWYFEEIERLEKKSLGKLYSSNIYNTI